ncbi:metal ABC transporter ATP-binding protein [Aeromicrobium sp.]|uniref:metal ABC transporter ATP-binding protein n=1 Tax=Aeromicrobium sp. TaxID=1871063 RepID=UPI003D6C6190
MTTVLSVRDASLMIEGRPVLQRVSLQVAEGEVVALLGANGSGKSTLVRAAIGLVPVDEGEVELFGTPLARFRSWQRLGYVPQHSRAVAGVPATVQEVVTSGRLSRRPFVGRPRSGDHEAVRGAVARVGLTDRLHSPLRELSGGQQQRALIARALAGDADLLVMDEPTSGVDHENQEALAELIGGLVGDGASVLLVAHELGPMRGLVGRAVTLGDGRVTYDGPVVGVTHEEHEQVHHHGDPPDPHPEVLGGEGVFR